MKHTITGHTGLICLLGSPCAHSISPMMHNAAFEALDLDYRYLAFDVNEETLPAAVDGLKAMNARGFNLIKTGWCPSATSFPPQPGS